MTSSEQPISTRFQIHDEEQPAKANQNAFPIIGIGGASGSLIAFKNFFRHMPANSGMAFVLVIHQASKEDEDFAKLIASYTTMPLVMAEDGMKVMREHVYLAPKNVDIGIHDGHLLLFNPSREKGAHMCIDHFFQSLAEDQWNLAVGIIFSGLGADGETGIRMIKEKLGMCMVQDPENAK